ncbi:MAG: hypothetical protein HC884_17390 [Chloroflexaceae bacterium]|nr:hypothetical protein [Chloroflexaceae bacterium]
MTIPNQVARLFQPPTLLIGLALVVGAALRLIENGHPFASSDHAELAAIITFFYPRSLESLIPSATSSWNMLTNPHGILSPLIGTVSMTLFGLMGGTINEFWWNLPFVLLNLLPIPLSAMLVGHLTGRRMAGAWAALLVALLPIHAALSRSSGLIIPVALNFHFVTILCCLRYFEAPTPRRAWWLGVALAVHLTVEMLFPVLLVLVFGVGLLSVRTTAPGLFLRFYRVRKLMFDLRVMLLPLLVLGFHLALLIAHSQGWTPFGGLAARLLQGSNRTPGLYPADFWNNATYAVGTVAFPILLLLGVASLPSLWRLELRALPVLWAIIYLTPFIVFTRPHVYEYFLFGSVPLTINAAMVIERWGQNQGTYRWLAGVVLPVLVVLFSLRTLSMVFGLDLVPLVGDGVGAGGGLPRPGSQSRGLVGPQPHRAGRTGLRGLGARTLSALVLPAPPRARRDRCRNPRRCLPSARRR